MQLLVATSFFYKKRQQKEVALKSILHKLKKSRNSNKIII